MAGFVTDRLLISNESHIYQCDNCYNTATDIIFLKRKDIYLCLECIETLLGGGDGRDSTISRDNNSK